MRKIPKCLTALALSGVLSISALAGTAQAESEMPADANLPIEAAGVERGARTGDCSHIFLLRFEYADYRNPTPMVHDVILIREGTFLFYALYVLKPVNAAWLC